jgi:uncharacterized tellurite resistance protein B-like protein
MLGKLKELLAGPGPGQEAGADSEFLLRRCLTALLVETSRADFEEHPDEASASRSRASASVRWKWLRTRDRMAAASSGCSSKSAREAVERSVSLHEFTAPLHRALDYAGKLKLVEMLWTVALGDHSLDKYEDYLVGKLAELLHVARGDVVRLRWQALQAIGDGPGPEPSPS